MNSQKKHPSDKLQKSSILFLQLGLVLSLFLVYGALEFETVKKKFPLADNYAYEPDDTVVIIPPVIINKPKQEPVKKKIEKRKLIDTYKKTPDNKTDTPTILEPKKTENKIDINKAIEKLPDFTYETPDEVQPFISIEEAPIFPGCEGLEKEASKKCFTKEISKFVNKKFNTNVADNLSGKQKIWVQFTVDKTGEIVDIKARAPHKRLEKEAIRVIEKLPQMTPGKQRKKPVGVKYTLPIAFQIY